MDWTARGGRLEPVGVYLRLDDRFRDDSDLRVTGSVLSGLRFTTVMKVHLKGLISDLETDRARHVAAGPQEEFVELVRRALVLIAPTRRTRGHPAQPPAYFRRVADCYNEATQAGRRDPTVAVAVMLYGMPLERPPGKWLPSYLEAANAVRKARRLGLIPSRDVPVGRGLETNDKK